MRECPHCDGSGWIEDRSTNTATRCSCMATELQRRAKANTARKYAQSRRTAGRIRARRRRRGESDEPPAAGHLRIVTRDELRARFKAMCEGVKTLEESRYLGFNLTSKESIRRLEAGEGAPFDERGFRTADAMYRAKVARWKGTDRTEWETTNEDCSTAMENRGRRRERRTAQYAHRRLVAMRLIDCQHMARSGAAVGDKDTILIRMRPLERRRRRATCTPLSGGTRPRTRGAGSPPEIVPTSSGGERGPAPPARAPALEEPEQDGEGSDEEAAAAFAAFRRTCQAATARDWGARAST